MSPRLLSSARLSTAFLTACLAAGALTACGDDDSSGSAASTPPAATTAATTPTTPAPTTPAGDDAKATSKDSKPATDDDADAGEQSSGDGTVAGESEQTPSEKTTRVKQVTSALEAAGFKVKTAPVVEPATAVLKVDTVSIVFYRTSAEAAADSVQFDSVFSQKPDQGIVRQEGRRVYFVTATTGKLTKQQRSDYAKIVKLSEAAQD